MPPLSPEANQVLYGGPGNLTLTDQLTTAYQRNLTEGVADKLPVRVEDAAALAVQAALDAQRILEDQDPSRFNLNRLTDRQKEIAEMLIDQVEQSFVGMTDATRALNHDIENPDHLLLDVASPEDLQERLEPTLMDWAKRGVLDYIAEQKEANPDQSFTLVATPAFTEGQLPATDPEARIQAALKVFAEKQPNATTQFIWADYCKGYSASDIYGPPAHPSAAADFGPTIRFSLVPTKYSPEIPANTAQHQNAVLGALQADRPELQYHIDSPLAQLTRLFTLRAQEGVNTLADFNLTFTRNFDLPEVDGEVPISYVSDDGFVNANANGGGARSESRVSVG